MLKMTCFKAGKGDSFLLSWENSNILIDAGIEGTYRFIRQKLLEIDSLDGILITHVDYDHIGGFFKFMEDEDNTVNEKLHVFMNTPSLYIYPDKSDLVKIEHGIDLNIIFQQKGLTPLSIYLGLYEKNRIHINGLEIQILSPTKEIVEELLKVWTANDIYKDYIEKSKCNNNLVSSTSKQFKSISEILTNQPQPKKWNNDLLNASSIAFIANYKKKK